MSKKKVFSFAAAFLLLCAFMTGCGAVSADSPIAAPTAPAVPKVTVPDITDVMESDGRNVLSSMGLIPKVEYVHNDSVPAGNIVSCSPACGSSVDPNTKVTVYVSLGPARIQSISSYANWTYITRGVEDDWEFYNPYIEDDTLYIECHNVTFGTAMSWRDRYNEGHASGTVSINDSFDKTVPVSIEYTQQSAKARESQSFMIVVPLGDLDVDRPTDLHFRIGITANGKDTNLEFSFAMTW